jgi:hemerythrin superfamily protein
MDAISLLKKDHRNVESLFKQFEKLDGAAREKKQIVQQIVRELSIHATIEEELLYPTARNVVRGEEDLVLESLEEHHVVKLLLSELESMNPKDERYDAKVAVLKETVMNHVEEEEHELFPALQKQLDKDQLNALGKALETAKKMAPTHPHPSAPDTPPGNLLAGLPAALVDKLRDLVTGTARRGQETRTTMTKRLQSTSMARQGRGSASGGRAAKKSTRASTSGQRRAQP